MKQLLLGAEAIAQAALDGGISGVYAYPGTPSTEITKLFKNLHKVQKPEFVHHGRLTRKQLMNLLLACPMQVKGVWSV